MSIILFLLQRVHQNVVQTVHTLITKLYRELRKSYSPFETKSRLMLITGYSTMTALEQYLRGIDVELLKDYSHQLK